MMTRREGTEYALTSGELGAAGAQTVVVALLPVLLARYAPSTIWIGFAIGGEGIFALLVPFWSGALSDRLSVGATRRSNGRLVVIGGAATIMAASIVVAPFVRGYWPLAVAAFVCFAGLHAYLTPFWALLIDAVPDERRGRVQGARGFFRALGLGYGLVAAGLLFSAWHPLPFLVAAVLLLATTAVSWAAAVALGATTERPRRAPLGDAWRAVLANPAALWLLLADAFWNAAFDGVRPYVFLYAHDVLGTDVWQTSLGLVLLVTGLGAGSWLVGSLADRHGRARVLELSSAAMAAALALGFFARNVPVALAIALVAGVAAAGVMALPYPLYASLMGGEGRGEQTGIFVMSVTIGRIAAPILVGGAVDVASRWMPRSHGYPAMWLVAALLAACGSACIRRSAHLQRPRDRVRSQRDAAAARA